MGRRSSLAIAGVHDFTIGAVDEVEARARWLAINTFDAPPITPSLSGLELEYRILQLYSRNSGEREATLQVDAGYGEQDLGYRSSCRFCAIVFLHKPSLYTSATRKTEHRSRRFLSRMPWAVFIRLRPSVNCRL